MNASMIWANFSVKDVERTRKFYGELGFNPNGDNKDPRLASFKFGKDDFVIHYFQEGSQIDNYLPSWPIHSNEIMFTLSAESKNEVDEFYKTVKEAGGSIINEPLRDQAGYYGFVFSDPDGHKFNVLLMDNM